MIDRIPPIHRMACSRASRGMGVMRLMGNPRQLTRPALDAESAAVLGGNIKALL
jgi:hypothetical protein